MMIKNIVSIKTGMLGYGDILSKQTKGKIIKTDMQGGALIELLEIQENRGGKIPVVYLDSSMFAIC